jgi:hypothetical protein
LEISRYRAATIKKNSLPLPRRHGHLWSIPKIPLLKAQIYFPGFF